MKVWAFVTVVATACCVSAAGVSAQSSPLQALTQKLSEWSAQSPRDVSMSVVWATKDGYEYLRCQITNRSTKPQYLDGARLPCIEPWSMEFDVFSTTGRSLYVQPVVKLDMPLRPPEPLMLHEGQMIERDMGFTALPFFNLANREDLNVVWHTTVMVFSSPAAVIRRYLSDADPIQVRLVGTTYIPKRRGTNGK